MLELVIVGYEGLTDDEKESVSNNGSGKEYAAYLRVIHNGTCIMLESDAMEPEDASFTRDLGWVLHALRDCYERGKEDGADEHRASLKR